MDEPFRGIAYLYLPLSTILAAGTRFALINHIGVLETGSLEDDRS